MKNLIAIVALAVAGCNYTKSTVRFPDGHSVTIIVERPEHYQDEEIEIITKGNRLFYSYQPNPQPLNSSETILQNAETALQNAPSGKDE